MPHFWFAVTILLWPTFIILAWILERLSAVAAKRGTLSDLGDDPKYGFPFRIVLVCSGLLQIVIFGKYAKLDFGLLLLMSTTIAGIFTGVIKRKDNKKLHDAIASTGFVLSAPGWMVFGWSHQSWLLLVWGLMAIPGVIILRLLGRKISYKHELVLFLGAFITNLGLVGVI